MIRRLGFVPLLLLAVVVQAATTFTALPLATYSAGTRIFGPVAASVGVTSVRASVDRTQMLSPRLMINWTLVLSQAGDTTCPTSFTTPEGNWLPWGAAGTVGGALTNPRTGLPITESNFQVALPQPDNPLRRLCGQVVNNESVTTTVTVTTLP